MCIAVPYLRIILHASYFHIAMFFLGESLFRIAGYFFVRVYELTKCRPSTTCSYMIVVMGCLCIAVGSSIGFSTIPFWMDVKDDTLRWAMIGMATLLYGLTRSSMEVSLRLSRLFEEMKPLEFAGKMQEKLTFVALSFGFLEVLLVFWIPTNVLDNIHIIMGLVGGVMLIQMASIFLVRCLLKGTDDPYKSGTWPPHTATCCGELASKLEDLQESLDVKAGVVLPPHLVFRMISHSLLIFAFDWYARHELDSSESSTNFYDINGASVGLAQMLLVPIVFLLVFPFVKDFLSKRHHVLISKWLISLLGIGTFLSSFFGFIYFQRNLFYFAFLSIGITICLLPLRFDSIEYLISGLSDEEPSEDDDEPRRAYRSLFELLDLVGTLLGSVISSIILEFPGYPIFLQTIAFSMGFVFIVLGSFPLFKICKSCTRAPSYVPIKVSFKDTNKTSKIRSNSNRDTPRSTQDTGTGQRVVFKRIVKQYV